MNMQKIRAVREDQRGLSTVEYVLLLVLIAAGSIAAWQKFGSALITNVNDQTKSMQGLKSLSAK